MPDSHLTKWALSQAMKELMTELPMEKIKIGDIVKRCKMNRQSFYYHFKDKYDLVNWIFYTEFFEDIQNSLEKPGWEILTKVCKFFYKNRIFYSNAFKVTGQNSFSEYFEEIMHPIILSQCIEVFDDDTNQAFYATFLADAIRVAISRWLFEGARIPPEEFVKLIKTAVMGVAQMAKKI
ncbi:TetR/AcrR family transcriptional regulator C-terminal domain-containing protein [Desulfitobacterium sp. AusDCA]|uniref:TetR/AcrR family transcriptional regulator C-terminal domain-containing protein n=1 Tax=Desulfitobacterium sp. AusDCA TaxID=3240383 RepID=UPI003DA79463